MSEETSYEVCTVEACHRDSLSSQTGSGTRCTSELTLPALDALICLQVVASHAERSRTSST